MIDFTEIADHAARVGVARHGRHAARHRPNWSAEERRLLRQHVNDMTLPDLARLINQRVHDGRAVRNADAVKIKIHRYQIGRDVKGDDEMTASEIGSEYLGKCGKSVGKLIDLGILPGRELPYDGRTVRVVRRVTLYRWATRPENWIYFKVGRMTDSHLKRLVIRAQSLWPDKWLRVGQVVNRVNRLYGVPVDYRDVNRAIVRHGLPAARWDNWFVKRGDVDAFDWAAIKGGKGAGHELGEWSPGGDEYIVLALAVGVTYGRIAANCGWDGLSYKRRAAYRLGVLADDGRLTGIAARLGVQVRDGLVFADWRDHADRFPGLARAVARFWDGSLSVGDGSLSPDDRRTLARMLAVWANWYADTPDRVAYAAGLWHVTRPSALKLQEIYMELLSWGIDPFGGHRNA